MSERIGNWFQTHSGRAFYPLDPRAEEVDILDIAHALSMICRFGGHCSRFYSVAEHSVRVSIAIHDAGGTAQEARWGLLHDASEAYCGDMIWPLKQGLQEYKAIEAKIWKVIAERFELSVEEPPIVKHFDLVLLSTEKRDLMNGDHKGPSLGVEVAAARERLGPWHSDKHEPLKEVIAGPLAIESAVRAGTDWSGDFLMWTPSMARSRFLQHYGEVTELAKAEGFRHG